MNKTLKLSFLLTSLLALAGCSTLGGDDKSKDTNNDGSQAVATTSTTGEPTAKVKLSKNNKDEIIAKIWTTYNGNPEGSVKLHWQAPTGTGCYDTQFPITKYGETKDMTWATVELKQGNKYCTGNWTASVMFDGKAIATDSINIK